MPLELCYTCSFVLSVSVVHQPSFPTAGEVMRARDEGQEDARCWVSALAHSVGEPGRELWCSLDEQLWALFAWPGQTAVGALHDYY